MQKCILAITDGIGINKSEYFNAFAAAKKPNYERLEREALKSELATSGLAVGLPDGQIGNSEVGHMCIGSGRVIFQSLVKIDRAIASGELATQPAMQKLLERARAGARVHVFGLYSDGGVHSFYTHFNECLRLLADASVGGYVDTHKVAINGTKLHTHVHAHLITDGRDVLGKAASEFLRTHAPFIAPSSIAGRFWAMDRDNNHERTEAYMSMLKQAAPHPAHTTAPHPAHTTAPHPADVLQAAIDAAKTDEFIQPSALCEFDFAPQDCALIVNFRADRARQLASALKAYGMEVCCMCEYDAALGLDVVFPPEDVPNCLAEIISAAGLRQLHTAETEKYAHVSFFFNGGREEPFAGEERILVPSQKSTSYAQTPKMSAAAITDGVLSAMDRGVEFIVLNYANGDMVGHTGDYEAAVLAVEEVDAQLGRLMDAAASKGYALMVSSDHGNCEQMRDESSGEVLPNHTTFDVGVWLWGYAPAKRLRSGSLANIAASVLEILGLSKPSQMQDSLIEK